MATAAQIKSEFNELPINTQLELLFELWDTLAKAPGAVTLSDDQRRELEHRYERHQAYPEEAISWAEVRDKIRSRRRTS